jgi:Pentapeptide repeats (8 copies)
MGFDGVIEVLIIVGEFGVDRTVGCGAMPNPLVVVTRQAPKPPMLGALILSNSPSIGEIIGRDRDVEVKWGCPGEAFWPGGDGCVLERGVMTAEELLERYAAGERDFSGIQLDGGELTSSNLSGINLSDADLSEQYLKEVNLVGANLRNVGFGRACLTKANLRNCDLTGADLTFANLARADLTNVCLIDAHLSGADLVEADLTGANLTGADLEGADMKRIICQETVWTDGMIWTESR